MLAEVLVLCCSLTDDIQQKVSADRERQAAASKRPGEEDKSGEGSAALQANGSETKVCMYNDEKIVIILSSHVIDRLVVANVFFIAGHQSI